MKKYIFVFITMVFLGVNYTFCADLYFMPREQKAALAHLQKLIKNSKDSIDIAIYSFTNRELAKALRDAAKRGVSVRVIYDESQNEDVDKSTIGYLAKLKNITVCMLSGLPSDNNKYKGIMHNKMLISDKNALALGSANWSKSAFSINYESLIILSEKELINKASAEFERIFEKCEKY